MTRSLAPVLASALLISACASALPARWNDADHAAIDAFFSKCDRYNEDESVHFDCGLYLFSAWPKGDESRHVAVVDAAVQIELEEPFTGQLDATDHRGETDWDGRPVDLSVVTYKPREGTIIQPSVEIYASQKVEGQRQFFKCFHTLAMVTDEANLAERLAGCWAGLKVLAKASR